MKKKWLILLLAMSPLLCWSGCYVWQNTKIPGPKGDVRVLVMFPIPGPTHVLSVSGDVQAVRFVPQEVGLRVEIKTTDGWYFVEDDKPLIKVSSLSMHFYYPKGKNLRDQTASFITMRQSFLGLESRAGYSGCPPLPGDVVTIRWSWKRAEKADQSGHYLANEVLVERVDREGKPWVHSSSWGHKPSEIIEVLIFDHKVDAL